MSSRVAPKTNISKTYYRHLVEQIEHDPLIRHSTVSVVCFIAAICVLAGGLLWFSKSNPGNLIQTQATVSSISSGKTDTIGTVTTFITFDFKTKQGEDRRVRQAANDGLSYSEGQAIMVGYHPKNTFYARNLHDNQPPRAALVLWVIPLGLLIWFTFLALFRHHARQVEIWKAAEAADSDD